MSNLMDWDELNLLRSSAVDLLHEYRQTKNRRLVDRWCDYMDFVLCLVYAYGWHDAEEIVGIVPFRDGLDDKAVNLEIKEETFRQRIHEQVEKDSLEGVLRIIDTESHRDYNTGVYDAAKESGIPNIMKRWNTMMDDRVRDQHQWLEGVMVGLDDYFYSDDGDSAMFPGDFDNPALNVNCRCSISLVRG